VVIGDTEKIFTAERSRVKSFFLSLRVCKNLFLLTANNPDGFGRAHNLIEVWFPRREYAVRQVPQGHSYDRICCHESDPGQSLIGKLRCVRYPIYMTSVFAKECVDHKFCS